jgi:hypothetical protein
MPDNIGHQLPKTWAYEKNSFEDDRDDREKELRAYVTTQYDPNAIALIKPLPLITNTNLYSAT